MASGVDQGRVAYPHPKHEAAGPRLAERPGRVHGGHRVAGPDAGDAGCDHQAFRRGQQDRGQGEWLAAERLADPDGAIAHRLDLRRVAPQRGRRLQREAAEEDAVPAHPAAEIGHAGGSGGLSIEPRSPGMGWEASSVRT
jgi:hypothetical protein